MNYEYAKGLTPQIAQELIRELFSGQTVQLQEIKEKVDEGHRERGGLPSNYIWHHPVTYALSKMKRIGLADNPRRGHWSISSSEADPDSEELDPIKTLNKFMEWIQELPRGEYVYRGVSNKEYPIEASTYRRLKGEKGEFRNEDKSAERLLQINREMIEDANRHRHGWENNQPLSDLNLLAKLQHSGAATCLIDFTKNPLVALWMACRKSGSGFVDGRVYAVEVGPSSPFKSISSDEALNMKIGNFFQSDEKIEYRLYQWQPHYQDNRMLAQQSVFLFGGGWGEIESSKDCIVAKKHKKEIGDTLRKSAGISEDILFPDFEGFASQRAQNKAYDEPDVSINTDCGTTHIEGNEAVEDELEAEFLAGHHLSLSLQAYREGNTEAAVHHYSSGMEFQPSDEILSHFYRERGIIYVNQGYFESAISDFTEALFFNSQDTDSYQGRGRAHYGLNRYTEAINDFDQVIDINPDNEYAFYWRGMVKYDQQQSGAALLDFDEAIRLNPNVASFYHWKGLAASNLGNYQEAIECFNQAITLDSANAYSYQWRGMAKYNLGQSETALLDFDEAVSLNSTDTGLKAHSYRSRGLVKNSMGLRDTARADYRMALMFAEESGNDNLINIIRQESSL